MNFLHIVKDGYFNRANRSDLPGYFFAQYKIAQREYFLTPPLFFNHCLRVIEGFKNNLKRQLHEEKQRIHEVMLYNQAHNEPNDGEEAELKELKLSNFSFYFSGHIGDNLEYCQIIQIENAINEAYQRAIIPESDQNQPEKEATELIKTFPEYFVHAKAEALAVICKNLFNTNSPKDYAIMVCLLTQNKLIHIPNRKQGQFFKAWYLYIGAPLPKNNNFTGITNYFDEIGADGYMFKEMDFDFLRIKPIFEKALIDNKIQ